jgi:hypothetical protein
MTHAKSDTFCLLLLWLSGPERAEYDPAEPDDHSQHVQGVT